MTATAYQDARDERTAQAKQLLEQGIGAIMDSDAFAAYLRTLSKLHRYSWRNVMLMCQQRPSVTLPNSYKRWQELGRQVRKGEVGMRIFVPIMPKRSTTDAAADSDSDESRPARGAVAFTLGSVFDIAQTDGADLALMDAPVELDGATSTGDTLYTALQAWLTVRGVTVTRGDTGHAKGLYRYPDAITLSDRLTGDQATKTLAHEAAHYICQHGRESIVRDDAETIAESVAFVVLNAYDIDSGSYTFHYVATWAREREVLTRNLDAIQKAAHAILDGLHAA